MRWLIGLISVGMAAHAAMRPATYIEATLDEGTNGVIVQGASWRRVLIIRLN